MLAHFRDILEDGRCEGRGVGAFTCYNLESAIGVVSAAEQRRRPAILLLSEAAFRNPTGPFLLKALRAVAETAAVAVCVQLDHTDDVALAGAAAEAGVGAVMADGARLPFEENVAFVQAVAQAVRRFGVAIEAELGHVAGTEDVAEATIAGELTNPDEVIEFVERTGADCLALSIGNVHGIYHETPSLDWALLEEISWRVPSPLALHGASGLADRDVRRAVSLGVVKVNVNTELRERYFAELDRSVPELRRGLRLLDLSSSLVAAVNNVVGTKLDLLEGPNREAAQPQT